MDIDNNDADFGMEHSFGLIVPGGPLRTDFQRTGDSHNSKFTLNFSTGDIPLHTIRELVLFFMPNFMIPPDQGVLCYWQITSPPSALRPTGLSTGFELLGALTPPSRMSAVFPTGWGENEQVVNMATSCGNFQVIIGLSIEPLVNIANIQNAEQRVQNGKLFVAEKIASDLFKFMQSFDAGTSGNSNLMVVPNNIFDRWFKRFSNRFQRDPNFFLKGSDD